MIDQLFIMAIILVILNLILILVPKIPILNLFMGFLTGIFTVIYLQEFPNIFYIMLLILFGVFCMARGLIRVFSK